MSHHNDTVFKSKWKRLLAIWLLNRVFRIVWRVLIAEVCRSDTFLWGYVMLGQNGCPPGSASAYSVHVRVHVHHFQHHRLCLCLHHCITNVLVSCLCNFRQPTGSVHLLNWSRLPVLKLVSRFLESWLFSPHLALFPCASAKILGRSVIERQHRLTNIGHYPRQLCDSKTIQSVLLKNQSRTTAAKISRDYS